MYFQLRSIERKKSMARLELELTTLAFEDHCSTTEPRNSSYFFGKKLLSTPIFFSKNCGPSNQIGEMALGWGIRAYLIL